MDNKQALGYMLLSCKQLGYTKKQMKEIYREMYWQFDLKNEEEAEEKGHEHYNSTDEDD